MTRAIALSMMLAVAACVPRPAPPPPPAPKPPPTVTPAPAPPAPRPANWQDWPLTPGDWSYARDARGTVAMYGAPDANAAFVARCDMAARRIYLSRPGNFADGVVGQITIRATTGVQSYPLANASDTPPYVAAALAPADPHLDAIAFSRGKFLVEVKGAADLVLPSWPELARVVEDCRG